MSDPLAEGRRVARELAETQGRVNTVEWEGQTISTYEFSCRYARGEIVRIEHTEAGKQVVISDTPDRVVPNSPLKPKRSQTEKPTLLEMYQEEIKQGKLF